MAQVYGTDALRDTGYIWVFGFLVGAFRDPWGIAR